jgi:hypothetical protein
VNDSNAQEPTDHHESAVLGHFTTYRLTREFWALGAGDRQHRLHSWLSGLQRNDSAIVTYLTQGLEHTSDVLVWSSLDVPVPDATREFFLQRARAEAPHRDSSSPCTHSGV